MAVLNLKPELRFPEFEKDWVRKKLGAVLNITSSSRVHKDEWTEKGVPFFRSSDVVADFKGDKNTKAYISFELYNSLSDKIGRVKKDDILITGGGSIGIPFLVKSNEPLYFKDADLLWIKNDNKINGYFLYSFFLTQSFREYLKSVSHVGTIAHYTVVQAKNTTFHFPTLPEQQKIASFLTAVDDKIQALKKKKSLLEQYKKGVMQKIFSQVLRFKDVDGSEFPEWEVKKVKELFTVTRGNVLSMTLVNEHQSDINLYPVYSSQTKNNGLSGYYEKYLFEDCITWTTDGAGAGDVNYRAGKFYCTNVCGVLKSDKGYANTFIAELINSVSRKHVSYVGNPKLMNNVMSEISIFIPNSIEEQIKIANFLSAIDEKIQLINNQIEKMEVWKKGLLQKMFV